MLVTSGGAKHHFFFREGGGQLRAKPIFWGERGTIKRQTDFLWEGAIRRQANSFLRGA